MAVLGIAASLFVLPGNVFGAPMLNAKETLEVCLSNNSKLAVLMLIDESKSLRELKGVTSPKPGNDPADSRVPALEAVVRVLASAVESSQLIASVNNKSLEVAIAISGFGDGYNERMGFRGLDSKNVEAVVSELEDQKDRDSDLHTRYHTALDGALASFENYSKSPGVCRLLVWFSDGEHDDDDHTGFVPREREQIETLLCGGGGIVDKLRLEGVHIVAAGLNSNERKLGLMRLIAQGGSPYRSIENNGKEGRVSVSVPECGKESPNGKYALARDADEIIDKLFEVLVAVPGIPNPKASIAINPASGVDCPDESGLCNSVEFEVDGSIASFQILAERPSSAVEVVLTTNEGQRHIALLKSSAGVATDKSLSINKNTVQIMPVGSKRAFISVSRKKENSIEGKWKLEFLGKGAPESIGTVNFIGSAEISIVDSKNQTISSGELKIGRFDAENLGIRVVSKTSGSSIRNLEVEFASLEGVEKLVVKQDLVDLNLFVLSEKEIERVLKLDKLKKLSSTDLFVKPVGDVPGLKYKDGTPVPISFGSQRFAVRVSDGAGLPSFVRAEGPLLFEGTPKQSIKLIFLGPDNGNGTITFKDAIESSDAKANLDLIPREPCEVPQQQEAVCVIELIPDQEVRSEFKTVIAVKYSGIDSTENPAEGEIPLDVSMFKKPSVGKGIVSFLELLALFLVIQGLMRYLLAHLLSRFSPLAATARRVRLNAIVDQSGAISLNPMQTNPSHSDEGFALEVTDSVQSFNVFGYDFSVSVMQTFLHSTAAPVGQVTSPSTFVIGARGYARSKGEDDSSTGHVSLVLRGQWIVGIKSVDLQRLLNGEASVAAEVVAFLEPYEEGVGIDRDQQLSDLGFALSASNIATEIKEILDTEREKTVVESGDEPDEIYVPKDIGDPFDGPSTSDASDEFGTTSSSQLATEPASESKRRKRRGRRSEPEEMMESQPEQSQATETWDPFA